MSPSGMPCVIAASFQASRKASFMARTGVLSIFSRRSTTRVSCCRRLEEVAGYRCLVVGEPDALAQGAQCHAELVDTSTDPGELEVMIVGRWVPVLQLHSLERVGEELEPLGQAVP
ncbi:hypothetical protein PG985_008189 [Apiospora marii]|uniref:Uncharacterized protein n=1 Tax=Apiospora marii TaxID=335849 RepID=A0ABR1RAK8_9PEZI